MTTRVRQLQTQLDGRPIELESVPARRCVRYEFQKALDRSSGKWYCFPSAHGGVKSHKCVATVAAESGAAGRRQRTDSQQCEHVGACATTDAGVHIRAPCGVKHIQ